MRRLVLTSVAGLLLAGTLAADPVAPAASAAVAPSGVAAAKPDTAVTPATAAAAKDDTILYPRTSEPMVPSRTASSGIGGTTLMLMVVLLGAAGGWLLWRRLRGLRDTGRGQKLAIAETRSLGNRQFLVVAAYGDRKFLLGVCPGRIDLLSSLDEAQTPHP